MRAVLIISFCLIAIPGLSSVMTCAEKNSAVFAKINDHKAGYLSIEDTCIDLTCSNDVYGLTCQGFFANYGYTVYIHEQETAVVSRSNGLNYDTLNILSCEESE